MVDPLNCKFFDINNDGKEDALCSELRSEMKEGVDVTTLDQTLILDFYGSKEMLKEGGTFIEKDGNVEKHTKIFHYDGAQLFYSKGKEHSFKVGQKVKNADNKDGVITGFELNYTIVVNNEDPAKWPIETVTRVIISGCGTFGIEEVRLNEDSK